jgi:hypothetical protein
VELLVALIRAAATQLAAAGQQPVVPQLALAAVLIISQISINLILQNQVVLKKDIIIISTTHHIFYL